MRLGIQQSGPDGPTSTTRQTACDLKPETAGGRLVANLGVEVGVEVRPKEHRVVGLSSRAVFEPPRASTRRIRLCRIGSAINLDETLKRAAAQARPVCRFPRERAHGSRSGGAPVATRFAASSTMPPEINLGLVLAAASSDNSCD
jgi:hypothetical protein